MGATGGLNVKSGIKVRRRRDLGMALYGFNRVRVFIGRKKK